MTFVKSVEEALFVKIQPLRLSGRCLDGAERDGGRLFHAVRMPLDDGCVFQSGWHGIALCGAKPGRSSAGWSAHRGQEITCKRCLKRRHA